MAAPGRALGTDIPSHLWAREPFTSAGAIWFGKGRKSVSGGWGGSRPLCRLGKVLANTANLLSAFSSQDKDKVSLTKTPKLDRSDGGKEVKERATKRKLPFTVGTNGDQKDSDTGTGSANPAAETGAVGLVGRTWHPTFTRPYWSAAPHLLWFCNRRKRR